MKAGTSDLQTLRGFAINSNVNNWFVVVASCYQQGSVSLCQAGSGSYFESRTLD